MSKILFWSPFHGQGQTSNLHATAFIMGLTYNKRVLMMQTHFYGNNLESPLIGQNVGYNLDNNYELFSDVGIDAAVTYSNMNKLNMNTLQHCCFTFPNTPIYLLPGTETNNRETFERDIGKSVTHMIKAADEIVDVILIDSNSGEDKLSFKLMNSADLIVVNLTQHRYVLDKFFRDYIKNFTDNKKVFYLFGDYDDNSSYNISNIRLKYHRYVNRRNSGVIPYSTKYLDAQNESNLVNFMLKGLKRSKSEDSKGLGSRLRTGLFSDHYKSDETQYLLNRSRLAVEKMFALLNYSKNLDRMGDMIEY